MLVFYLNRNHVVHKIPLSKMGIQTIAKSLFNDTKSQIEAYNINSSVIINRNETFKAIRGWF